MAFDPSNLAMQVTPDMAFSGLDASYKIQQARLAAAQAYQANQAAAQTAIQNKYLGPNLAAKLQEEQTKAEYAQPLTAQDLLTKQLANKISSANAAYAPQQAAANVNLTRGQASQAYGAGYNQTEQGDLAKAKIPLQPANTAAQLISAVGSAGTALLNNLNNPAIQAAISSDKTGTLAKNVGQLLNNYVGNLGGIGNMLYGLPGSPVTRSAVNGQSPGIGDQSAPGMQPGSQINHQQLATFLALRNAGSSPTALTSSQPSISDTASAIYNLATANQIGRTLPAGSETMAQMGQRANVAVNTMQNALDSGAAKYFGPIGQVKLGMDHLAGMLGDKSVVPGLTAYKMFNASHSEALATLAGLLNTPANMPARAQLEHLLQLDPLTTPANVAKSYIKASQNIIAKAEEANKIPTAALFNPQQSSVNSQEFAANPAQRIKFNLNGKSYSIPQEQWSEFSKLTPAQQAAAISGGKS